MRRLFFVAIIPDEPVYSEVTGFKEYMAAHFASRRALRSPPHITLFPPFWFEEEELRTIHEALFATARSTSGFRLELNGFAAFKPRVIFVRPVMDTMLINIHERVKAHILPHLEHDKPSKRPFHAHMTIAFRDLRKKMFWKAWDVFKGKDYERAFEVRSLFLLKHNKRKWIIEQEYGLKDRGMHKDAPEE